MSKERLHTVYLLSLWQAHTEGEPMWRAWLECPTTGERRGFATLDGLCSYLKTRAYVLEGARNAGTEGVLPAQDVEWPKLENPRPSDQDQDR